MTYVPYLIANFATGLDRRLQPWLIPDEAQEEIFDGYVYRGTMSKRDGYNYLAIGERDGSPYRESRIIHTLSSIAPTTGVINGTNRTFTFALNTQIARGSITITGSSPSQVLVDNGVGGFTGPGTGMVNYITGAVTVTFTVAPANASTVLLTYSFMPGNPVMMVASFYTTTNSRQLIVADTQYVNRYNTTTNILEDISPGSPYTGTNHNFFTWVNYQDASSIPRLIFANNKDNIQSYDGTGVTDYVYTMDSSDNPSVPVTSLTCLLMANFKDRLVLLRTTENGTIFPRRIRISGTGTSCDDFRESATGAGFIDMPDNTWIYSAAYNRDDLIIFTEGSTWSLKYTGNDSKPFVLVKLDESRGCQAPFSGITYLNRTSAASPRGLIITDGYRVERQDLDIPDFSYNDIDGENFDLCFAGSVDADRDHYLIYPPEGQLPPEGEEIRSLRILTTNYDEDNYSIYRLPLSCMGTYVTSFDVTWDTLGFDNWDQFSDAYSNWNSFAFEKGEPFSIGGGHYGEIWRLSVTEGEDNPVRIRNIVIIDDKHIQLTTDWNNYGLNLGNFGDPNLGADYIFLSGVDGMEEVNGKQYAITTFIDHNNFIVDTVDSTANFSAYTGGGSAIRVIPFEALTKQFNPFVNTDKKVRCGWLYMYVDTSGTNLTRNIPIVLATNSSPCVITTGIDHNLSTGQQVLIFGVGGMTELNGIDYTVTVLTSTTFALNGVDSTGFGVYTTGGYASVSVPATISIEVMVDDREDKTQLNAYGQDPYQGNCTNFTFTDGIKKWYKVYINQTGKFIQFRLKNTQAGTNIHIQAMMPGFQPVGRLI